MNTQEVLVMCLFLVAIVFIARVVYRNFSPKTGCAGDCKCGVDFSEIKSPEKL